MRREPVLRVQLRKDYKRIQGRPTKYWIEALHNFKKGNMHKVTEIYIEGAVSQSLDDELLSQGIVLDYGIPFYMRYNRRGTDGTADEHRVLGDNGNSSRPSETLFLYTLLVKNRLR